ncbi:hypothetical protein Tco_0096972 [Tanacetum coccineum]
MHRPSLSGKRFPSLVDVKAIREGDMLVQISVDKDDDLLQCHVGNVYGDHNLICILQPPQDYEEKAEATGAQGVVDGCSSGHGVGFFESQHVYTRLWTTTMVSVMPSQLIQEEEIYVPMAKEPSQERTMTKTKVKGRRALLKLQAVVGGRILNKQTADMMRRLQSLTTTELTSHNHHHKSDLRKCLCEYVSFLIIFAYEFYLDVVSSNAFSDEVRIIVLSLWPSYAVPLVLALNDLIELTMVPSAVFVSLVPGSIDCFIDMSPPDCVTSMPRCASDD